MFATGETVDLAEWIIDDTCLVMFSFRNIAHLKKHFHINRADLEVSYSETFSEFLRCLKTNTLIWQLLSKYSFNFFIVHFYKLKWYSIKIK